MRPSCHLIDSTRYPHDTQRFCRIRPKSDPVLLVVSLERVVSYTKNPWEEAGWSRDLRTCHWSKMALRILSRLRSLLIRPYGDAINPSYDELSGCWWCTCNRSNPMSKQCLRNNWGGKWVRLFREHLPSEVSTLSWDLDLFPDIRYWNSARPHT